MRTMPTVCTWVQAYMVIDEEVGMRGIWKIMFLCMVAMIGSFSVVYMVCEGLL